MAALPRRDASLILMGSNVFTSHSTSVKRRTFMATAAAAVPFAAQTLGLHKQERQYFELTEYHTHVGERRSRVADFYRDVALPALDRLGIGPVGVFTVTYGPTRPSLFVLVPHDSLESVTATRTRLLEDDTYRRDGAAFLEAPLSDPAYVRQERQLLVAFKDMPRIEAPVQHESRIFELRVYESHSERAGQKKIDMFNEGGEIAIFRKTGLTPVFFGETLYGPRIPNLTYMLSFENMQARDEAWATFVADPDWIRLRDDPQYADTVSNISDVILRPTPFSQI